jgi:signal peptidase II
MNSVPGPSLRPSSRFLLLGLALPLFLLDQATKWAALRWIHPHETIEIIPGFFNLVLVFNTGAAFGMMAGRNVFFLLLSIFALSVITFFWWRGSFREPWTRLAVALLIAGVAGNLMDRIFHGAVVDFLDFILPVYGHWPAFNVADSCICIAAFSLVIQSLRPEKPASSGM